MAERKSNIIEFEYDGRTWEADASVKGSYIFAMGMATAGSDPAAFFKAMDMLFPDGRHLDYASRLEDDMERIGELAKAAIEAVGAKN